MDAGFCQQAEGRVESLGGGTMMDKSWTGRSQESTNRRESRNAPRQHDGEITDGQFPGVCQQDEVPKGKSAPASSYEYDNLSELERVRNAERETTLARRENVRALLSRPSFSASSNTNATIQGVSDSDLNHNN
jgi:hypothetical protein